MKKSSNHETSNGTWSVSSRRDDHIRGRFRAFAANRAERNELHQLVITSKDADAESVSREHDDERHVERHYRTVQNELPTKRQHTTQRVTSSDINLSGIMGEAGADSKSLVGKEARGRVWGGGTPPHQGKSLGSCLGPFLEKN